MQGLSRLQASSQIEQFSHSLELLVNQVDREAEVVAKQRCAGKSSVRFTALKRATMLEDAVLVQIFGARRGAALNQVLGTDLRAKLRRDAKLGFNRDCATLTIAA